MINNNNFYMPAEWEIHERTFIEWPVKESMVYPENYNEVSECYAEVAKAIAEFEKVTMIVNEKSAEEAKLLCGDKVEYMEIPHNDAWCRDNGPTFLISKDGKRSAVNWKFNAWGEKYTPYNLDDKVASEILNYYKLEYFNVPIVLEGGSIHVDGEGTLLTTKECLLNKNRNADLNQEQIESYLKQYLNISKIIWLENGLYGDETDGHVDNAACFAAPGIIIIQSCYDKEDPNYEIFMQSKKILENTTDAQGRKIEIIEIPQPPARYYKGERLTLSYLNFYIVNDGIILPVFGDEAEKTDEQAESMLKKIFPDRKIRTVNTSALITEGGNIHCITQQMPLRQDDHKI